MKNTHHKPRGSILAALDIGSSKVSCFIGRVVDNEGTFEILGVGNSPSKGLKNGKIIDINEAEASVRSAVHTAENMAADIMKGYPLREVVVNVPNVHTATRAHSVVLQIEDGQVSFKDIQRALAQAQAEVISEDYELIHTIPVSYSIDGHDGVSAPLGMHGKLMEVDINLISGQISALENIATPIEHSHLDITAFCNSAYAAGLACLVEDEMDLGCTVIDIGGGITSFAVFQNRTMKYSDFIPVGGDHVTNDIAKGLTTSVSDAERLKILYGSAMGSTTDESEMIDVPQLGESPTEAPHHVPRSVLVGIIQPRLEEILEMVRAKLDESGLGSTIGRRVVLTGGGSQIAGLRTLTKHVLDKQVRLGKPIRLSGLPDAVSGPAFATTAGLLTYISERSSEIPAEIMLHAEKGSTWGRLKAWMKENW